MKSLFISIALLTCLNANASYTECVEKAAELKYSDERSDALGFCRGKYNLQDSINASGLSCKWKSGDKELSIVGIYDIDQVTVYGELNEHTIGTYVDENGMTLPSKSMIAFTNNTLGAYNSGILETEQTIKVFDKKTNKLIESTMLTNDSRIEITHKYIKEAAGFAVTVEHKFEENDQQKRVDQMKMIFETLDYKTKKPNFQTSAEFECISK